MTDRDEARSTTDWAPLVLVTVLAVLLLALRSFLELSWPVTTVIGLALSVLIYLWLWRRRPDA